MKQVRSLPLLLTRGEKEGWDSNQHDTHRHPLPLLLHIMSDERLLQRNKLCTVNKDGGPASSPKVKAKLLRRPQVVGCSSKRQFVSSFRCEFIQTEGGCVIKNVFKVQTHEDELGDLLPELMSF